jgi:T-complex protein 1 subunit eta
MDKLIVDERGQATISSESISDKSRHGSRTDTDDIDDGATILKLLDIVHPAARTLVDIARAQDAEVGDGTTSVTIL